MSKLSETALGFGPVRSAAGLILALESVNNIKTAILELRQQIEIIKGAPIDWQTPIALKNIDNAITDLLYVESQIAPDIQKELNSGE